MKLAILASALACLLHSSDAFTVQNGLSAKAPSAFVNSGRNARFSALSMAEEAKAPESPAASVAEEEPCAPEEGEYCPIDEKTGKPIQLTLAEKEKIFVDALQSYYISGKQSLDDAEFDLLKEDLSWNGSKVVQMNRKEARYLASLESYLKGEPIMSDAEFDTLKKELKAEGSRFAVSEEPKCVVETGICTVTLKDDNFRSNLIYLPATFVLTIVWLGFGFELIEPFVRLNPLFLTLLGSPLIYRGTKKITDEYIFPGNKIVYGPCPNCEAEQRAYFGDILGIEGFKDVATVKCSNCKTEFTVQKDTLRATTTTPKN